MRAARKAGAVISFDLNFREKLWSIWGGEKKAVDVVERIVENVDVLVGNEEDLQKGLGIPGPKATAKSKLDPEVFLGMMEALTAKHPNVSAVATTLREVHSSNRHSWSGGVGERAGMEGAGGRTRRARPGRRGGWFCKRVLLRPPLGGNTRGSRETGLGARGSPDDVPG